MEEKGLELRNVEGLAVLPEAAFDLTTFEHAWQFLVVKYTARNEDSYGATLHPQTDPHSSCLTVAGMGRSAKKIPRFPPPHSEKGLIIIGTDSLGDTLAYLERASEAADSWLVHLRSYQPAFPPNNVRLEASTVEDGAKALLEAVQCLAAGTVADLIGDTFEVLYFTEEASAARTPHVTIGDRIQAVGPGPLRAVFGRALQIMVEDETHWMKTSDDCYYTPVIPGMPTVASELTYFKSCGIMLRLAFLWKQNVIPISPMLLALLIGGPEAALDRSFLAAVAPELASRLATWPPPRVPSSTNPQRLVYDVSLGQDPMNLVMEFVANTQIAHIRSLSIDAAEELTKIISSGLLFQTREMRHPIFDALQEGLNCRNLERVHMGSQVTSTLLDTFDGRPVPQIIAGLCANRRIVNYAALIPMLEHQVLVDGSEPGFDSSLAYNELSTRWMQALQRYLSGTGHPNHSMFTQTPDDSNHFLSARASLSPQAEAFRPTLFMQAISDSVYLPQGSSNGDKIHINFDVCFHTCSLTMDVLISEGVASLLEDELPSDNLITTQFDVYIHALLLNAQEEYNAV
ncbi:hypothetical protein C2E23DRAFT_887706 [Lenzites betulinus]|nr:hypothetical protein C2E23DRAFT_887706 [Lenzites betulinus]